MTTVALPAPWRHDNNEVTIKAGKPAGSFFGNLNEMLGTAKTSSDCFALLQKGAPVAQKFLEPGSEISDLTSRIGSGASTARNWTTAPYAITLWYKYFADSRSDYLTLGDSLWATGYSAVNVLPKGALSETVGSCSSTLKTATEIVYFKRTLEAYSDLSANLVEAEKAGSQASSEVKTALKDSLRETTLKIFKYALGVFSGLVAFAAFAFGAVIPPAIAVAALFASFGGAIFSFAADYQHQSMPWHAKVTKLA